MRRRRARRNGDANDRCRALRRSPPFPTRLLRLGPRRAMAHEVAAEELAAAALRQGALKVCAKWHCGPLCRAVARGGPRA
eukprot:5208093-Pyramimonas_sp.AAC.1